MNFAFFNIYRHIYRKWVSLVDSKCRNTVILTGLTYTSSRKVFHDGCAKRGIFSQQIFNKNSLSLAHCAVNRSFTVSVKQTNALKNITAIISQSRVEFIKLYKKIFNERPQVFIQDHCISGHIIQRSHKNIFQLINIYN